MIWTFLILGFVILLATGRSVRTLITCKHNIKRGMATYSDLFIYIGVQSEQGLQERCGKPDTSGYYCILNEDVGKAWPFYWYLWFADLLTISLVIVVSPALAIAGSSTLWIPIAFAILIRATVGLSTLVLGLKKIKG